MSLALVVVATTLAGPASISNGFGSRSSIAYGTDPSFNTPFTNLTYNFVDQSTQSYGFTAFTCVATNGTIWVAGGNQDASFYGKQHYGLAYSYDAVSWTRIINFPLYNTGNAIVDIAYGNGKFVAIGRNASTVSYYSIDGISWVAANFNPKDINNNLISPTCIRFNSTTNVWVMGLSDVPYPFVGFGLYYSTDGINWNTTIPAIGGDSAACNAIATSGSIWVASASGNPKYYYSYNGITWYRTTYTNHPYRIVEYNGTYFVGVNGISSNNISNYYTKSTDGINWTEYTNGTYPRWGNKGKLLYYNNRWYLFSSGFSGFFYHSSDFNTPWTNFRISTSSPLYSEYYYSYAAIALNLPKPPPVINSITYASAGFNVNFTPDASIPISPTTYYYSINGGSTYINANKATSPITIAGLSFSTTYNIKIIGNYTTGNTLASSTFVGYIPYPCFREGTQILRKNTETGDAEYSAIETLRKGDLIKTYSHGYVPIHTIGYSILHQPKDNPNIDDRLYRFIPEKCPELFEDLYITGNHCILYTKLKDELKSKVIEHMDTIFTTEGYYRVPSFLDERAMPYEEEGPATIWHFALENNDIYENYGVYANGLLVESSSIRYMTECSNMELV